MWLKQYEGEIDLTGHDYLNKAQEVVRIWVEKDGPNTFFVNVSNLPSPFEFGILIVDLIRQASLTYAETFKDAEEAHTLKYIWEGIDAERALNTDHFSLTPIGTA